MSTQLSQQSSSAVSYQQNKHIMVGVQHNKTVRSTYNTCLKPIVIVGLSVCVMLGSMPASKFSTISVPSTTASFDSGLPRKTLSSDDMTVLENFNPVQDMISKLPEKRPKRFCPCCGWTGEVFRGKKHSNIGDVAPDRSCPQCGALERHRRACGMLACNHTKPFFNRVHEDTPFRLVHFGPQQGMMNVINRFLPSIDQVGVDYFAESYIYDKSRTLHADVTDLKFPDNFANGIIILHVLEHIRALETAAKEMLRVLAPGGWIVMEVPCNQKKETKDCRKFNESVDLISCAGQRDHVWSFNCRDFQDDMKEYGMKCEAGYELDNQKDCLDPSLRESILPKPGSAPVLFCVRND